MLDKIAACMMVRGNEPGLEKSLASIRDEVDVIALLYTGIVGFEVRGKKPIWKLAQTPSGQLQRSDRDQKLFDRYRCIVKESPWNWDFSQHRNEAFLWGAHNKAQWGYVHDADEELKCPKDGLRKLIGGKNFHGTYMFHLHNILGGGKVSGTWQVRFVSLLTRPYYEERIHNKLRTPGFTFSPRVGDAEIIHSGYSLPREEMRYKVNHRIRLVDDIIDTEGRKPELLFYKASLLHKAMKLDVTVDLCNEYERLSGTTPDELSLKGDALRRLGRYKEAIDCLLQITELSPYHMDAWYYAGMMYASNFFKTWAHPIKGIPNIKQAEYCMAKHKELADKYAAEPAAYPCEQELFTFNSNPDGMKMLKQVKAALEVHAPLNWIKEKAGLFGDRSATSPNNSEHKAWGYMFSDKPDDVKQIEEVEKEDL